MNLPFTVDQFLDLFGIYNRSIWPFQIFLNVIAVVAVVLVFTNGRHASEIISAIISFLWLWMGIVYHITYFRSINPIASVFGVAFLAQGLSILYLGVIKNTLVFSYQSSSYKLPAFALLLFSLVIYPIIGDLLGHQYPQSATFGLPCPTTIFTIGFLLLSNSKVALTIVPLAWSIIGFSAALFLGMLEDTSLLIAAILFVSVRTFRTLAGRAAKKITRIRQ